MPMDTDTLTARVQARHISTGLSFSDVAVEVVAVADDRGTEVVAEARTGPDGVAVMDLDPGLWGRLLKVRVAGVNDGVALNQRTLAGDETVALDVQAADRVDPGALARLADHLVATRMVRADDVARDLAAPRADSVARLLPRPTGPGCSPICPRLWPTSRLMTPRVTRIWSTRRGCATAS